MASAGEPSNATGSPIRIFNEDEDEDEDDESEDDSASSAVAISGPPASVDLPPPSAQVTIAFPGVSDLRPEQDQRNQPEIAISRKPPLQPDESRKLFQRLWTDEDEIELLQGFLDYTTQRGGPHNSSHHHDTTAFYDQIKSKFQLDFNKNQLVEKLRRLKKKYRNVVNKFGSGRDYGFKSPHDQTTFEISAKIWGTPLVNGSSTVRPASIDEDDDDAGNPSFIDFLSPNLSGPDPTSRTPRPKKRNRTGGVKVEDKHHLSVDNNISNNLPSPAVMPMVTPVTGMGLTGSMSAVIEETVKSCLSPVFKELLGSMNSNSNNHGLFCRHGLGLVLSPVPFGVAGAIGGDKMADDKWRKQQILELEVFSKRLELVQDQINAQLQELRSMGN